MKMKKSLLAILAMSSVAGVAHADANAVNNDKVHLDFYGVIDVAYGTVEHSLGINSQYSQSVNPVSSPTPIKASTSSAALSSQSGLFNGGLQDPRFGFNVGYDFGNGWNAFLTLEEGVNLTTAQANNSAAALAQNGVVATTAATGGSLDGQLFNRQAFVGLSSDKLGSVAVGRNYAPMYDVASKYDPVQFAQLFSPLGFSATYGGGGGVSEDARVQNSIKYTNKIGSFNFGAISKYQGAAGDSTAKSGYGLNVGYEKDKLGIQAAYQVFNDALKGSPGSVANTVKVSVYDTKAFMIAAKYKFNDAATAKIGYESFTLSAPSDLVTIVNYYGQAIDPTKGKGVVPNTTIAPQQTNIIFIGGDYNFTEKFNLAAGIYDISPQQSSDYTPNAGTTTAKAGQASGDQRYYSLLADYHFTKTLDSYAGLMYSTYSGNANPSATYYQSNQIVAVGTRFTF